MVLDIEDKTIHACKSNDGYIAGKRLKLIVLAMGCREKNKRSNSYARR